MCCAINHESLKIWFRKLMLQHHLIKLCLHDLLSFGVLKLHVTNHNGHQFTIGRIVHMTSCNCLASNTLHMIKHDPNVMQILYKLHLWRGLLHSPRHLSISWKWKPFILQLVLGSNILGVVIKIIGLQFKDVINITTPWTMFERSNKVMNVGWIQFKKLVLNLL